ncbi:TonB-dependent receptor [Sphingopyxis yananensis]|uniref:TonB-dependent receptor n=1 Tax=Sphingopyxis yananensis TaxID=2886687 RepID=UPI001D100CB7|nr:TonB-dependent receptor [Sphingopyxis yananensis]MCC2601060.1 TonB-dependent receptor [Sphingopyxis yananensis]
MSVRLDFTSVYKIMLMGASASIAITPAMAQETAPDGGLEEIIVTAQKREESLQDTPISLAVFGSEGLATKGISGLVDLRSHVPNLQLTPHPNSASTTQIFMRGVGLADDQITQDGSVAVYMDGVYVARSQGQALEVAELERVEVLRGPQGTLYGRNATGGAINFVTRKPELGDFGAKLQATVGNLNNRRYKAAVNIPMGETLAARLSYANIRQDGFVKNLGTGVDRWGDKRREAMRADIYWQPSDAFNLRYSYDRSNIDDTPAFLAFSPLYPLKADCPVAGSEHVRDLLPNEVVSQGHSLTAEWDVGDALTVRSITAHRKLRNFQNQDYLSGITGPAPFQKNQSNAHQKQWSQEIQLVGDTANGEINYVAGLYWFSEDGSNFSNSYTTSRATRTFTTTPISNRSFALFSQVTYSPEWADSRLHITAGARHSWDKREAMMFKKTQKDGGSIIDDPAIGDGSRKFKDFSPSLVVAYDLADHVNIYGKVVRGYKSGGYNTRASSIEAFDRGFGAESLWSYEAGLKSQWLDNKLRFNIASFLAKYNDIQVNVQSDPDNIRITDVLNAGKATIKGVEADLTLVPTKGLRFSLNYGYLDPQYDEILDATGKDISSKFRFNLAPKHSLAVEANYEIYDLPIGTLAANINYTMQSKVYTSATISSGKYITGDYGLLNARLSLTEIPGLDGLRLSAWGRNLTDKQYYTMQFNVGAPAALFGDPRTYGLDLSFEF